MDHARTPANQPFPPSALEMRAVSKRYGNVEALSGVDLMVAPGTVHGLIGVNGAGKSTLLRIALGLVRRDEGELRVLGRTVPPAFDAVPADVAGFVDAPAFYPYLTGARNLSLLQCLDGVPSRERATRALEAFARVGLAEADGRPFRSYSTGMRARLALAAALVRRPRLLLLDEPTSSVDPAGTRAIRQLVRSLADEGVAVVLSSHDMAEVEDLCDALTLIHAGRVLFSGGVPDFRQRVACATHSLQTSDDVTALLVAGEIAVTAHSRPGEIGLLVSADERTLDAYVLALARRGVAVRKLEPHNRSLESVFFELTGSASPSAMRPS